MLLAFIHFPGHETDQPVLCIVPDRPDQFSVAAPVDSLGDCESAVYRSGPEESFLAKQDQEDGSIIIEPCKPAKLYLTPNLHERPGIHVRRVKIAKHSGMVETFFLQDRHEDHDWQPWLPFKVNR